MAVIYYTAFDGEVLYGEIFVAKFMNNDNRIVSSNASDSVLMIPPAVGQWECE